MTIDANTAEIRAAVSTLLALQAQDRLSRADLLAAANFVEARCDEIEALAPRTTGETILPVLTLADVAAEAKAGPAAASAPRKLLRLVYGAGGAA